MNNPPADGNPNTTNDRAITPCSIVALPRINSYRPFGSCRDMSLSVFDAFDKPSRGTGSSTSADQNFCQSIPVSQKTGKFNDYVKQK
jgi:hypothetical protein